MIKILSSLLLIVCTIIPVYASEHNNKETGCRAPIQVYDLQDCDVPPRFPGGDCGLVRYVNAERVYPVAAYKRGVHGRVFCSFIVMPDGLVSHIAVLRGVEESLNREAVRIISEMPAWTPGQVAGQNVPVLCFLSIPFRR